MPSGGSVHAKMQASGGNSFFSNLDYGEIVTGVLGIFANKKASTAGSTARDFAYADAAEMLRIAGENAGRVTQIAGINASAVRSVAYANAASTERAAFRNGQLMIFEGAEILRRHVRQERYTVGDIRARQAATGWSVNEGSLVLYKESQKKEMLHSRKYTAAQQQLSLFTMLSNARDQAQLTRYAGDQVSDAMLASAAIEREILLSEAQAQYLQMARTGDLAERTGKSGTSGWGRLIGGAIGANWGPVGSAVGGAAGDFLEGTFF